MTARFPDQFLDDLRARVLVSDVVARKFKMRKQGTEFVAVEDPSLHANNTKRIWHDFGSRNDGGDIFDWFTKVEGRSFPEAVAECAALAGVAVPNGHANGSHGSRPVRPDKTSAVAPETAAGRDRHGDPEGQKEIEATFDYLAADGSLRMQVVRYVFRLPDGSYQKTKDGKRKKLHLQRCPDGRDGWIWKMDGVVTVPYNLPAVIEAVADDKTIFVVEGEKKADALGKIGFVATCNPAGAGKWPEHFGQYFNGARVVILPDNDEAGRKHASQVGENLDTVAASVMVLDLPDLPPKGDVVDWLAEGGTADEFAALQAAAKPWAKEVAAFQSRFNAVPWERLDEPGPEYEFVIDGWFTIGDKSIIGGPSKSGKSFLAIHAAMATARATPFFGAKVMAPGLVVYQAGEGARGIKKRLRAYRQHFGVPKSERVPFVLLQAKVDLYRPDGDTTPLIEEIKAICAQYPESPLRAVFIDTLATATGGADENSGKDMSTVMANIDRISTTFGCHVCLVHHLNAAGTKLRGHTSIFNNIDQAIFVTRDETTKVRTAILDKQKDDEDGGTLRFELASIEIGRRKEDSKPITSCVCVQVGEREMLRKVTAAAGFALKKQEEPIFRALMNATKAKGRAAPPEALAEGVPADVFVVDYRDWRDAYKQVADAGADGSALTDETIRKRWRDNSPGMVRFEVIGWHRPWIWWTGKPIRGFAETQPKTAQVDWTGGGQWPDEGRTDAGLPVDNSDLDEFFGKA